MVDWLTVLSTCVLAALLGLGFVLWERYDDGRLARARLRRHSRARRRSVPLDVDRPAA